MSDFHLEAAQPISTQPVEISIPERHIITIAVNWESSKIMTPSIGASLPQPGQYRGLLQRHFFRGERLADRESQVAPHPRIILRPIGPNP